MLENDFVPFGLWNPEISLIAHTSCWVGHTDGSLSIVFLSPFDVGTSVSSKRSISAAVPILWALKRGQYPPLSPLVHGEDPSRSRWSHIGRQKLTVRHVGDDGPLTNSVFRRRTSSTFIARPFSVVSCINLCCPDGFPRACDVESLRDATACVRTTAVVC